MGNLITLLFKDWFKKREQRLLLIGLDNAGKTTILYKLRLGDTIHTIPTIGFNVEQVTYKNLTLTIWDVGGQEKIRPLWRHYYAGVNGIIFVVDSNDKERLEEASEELHKLMREQQLNNSPLLVLANKQDLPAATPVADITRKLNLHDIYEKMQNFKSFETKVLIVHYNEQSKLLFQTTSILFSYILFSLNDVIILNVCAYIITFERESLDSSTVSSPHWFWTASRNRLVGSADVGEKVNLLVNSNVCT